MNAEIIAELERTLDALREEQKVKKRDRLRRRGLELSDRLVIETGQWLIDSGVFDAMEDES